MNAVLAHQSKVYIKNIGISHRDIMRFIKHAMFPIIGNVIRELQGRALYLPYCPQLVRLDVAYAVELGPWDSDLYKKILSYNLLMGVSNGLITPPMHTYLLGQIINGFDYARCRRWTIRWTIKRHGLDPDGVLSVGAFDIRYTDLIGVPHIEDLEYRINNRLKDICDDATGHSVAPRPTYVKKNVGPNKLQRRSMWH